MSSIKSYTEDTKADHQDCNYKLLAHLKTYSFFIFYQPTHSNIGNPSLQVIFDILRKWTSNWEMRELVKFRIVE